jgi:hypothetical protein
MPKQKEDSAKSPSVETGKRSTSRPQISAKEMPRRSIEDILPICQFLYRNFSGSAATTAQIADSLGLAEKSTNTTYAISAAEAYGLIIRKSEDQFSLTETGRKVIAPLDETERIEGLRKALLTPSIPAKFYADHDRKPIPTAEYLPNILEVRYGVLRNRIEEAADILLKNARYSGVVVLEGQDQTPCINLQSAPPASIHPPVGQIAGDEAVSVDLKEQTAKKYEDFLKICFFICPIGEEDSVQRKHSDTILRHLVEPVCKKFDLEAIRADKIERSGLITSQILQHLTRSRICIADLSFSNPNVFYELGVRHVFQLPSIQMIRKGDKLPFDVSQGRTIQLDLSDIYTVTDRLESARNELEEYMRAILEGAAGEVAEDNPIRVYLPGAKAFIPKM